MKESLFIALTLCVFKLSAQNTDSVFLKQFGLKGIVHSGEDFSSPKTVIDSIMQANMGLSCNQYLVKYFCEYQRRYNYKKNMDVKLPDYPLFAKELRLPNIFINGVDINILRINNIKKYTNILKYEKGITKGLSPNTAYYFELK